MSLSVRPCTAVCWREGGSWVVHVPELDRSAVAARLSQVEGIARDLLDVHSPEGSAARRVVVDLRVHERASELIAAAADLRDDPYGVSVEAVTLRRGLARRLAAEGFEVRDVAALLGLSYGRTLSLLKDGHARRPVLDGDQGVVPRQRTPASGRTERPRTSYRHEALVHHGQDELLESTTDFVLDAVASDEPVVVAVPARTLAPLRAAVGEDAPVAWLDMAEVGANPGRILPALQAFVEEHHGRPVRAVGVPVWAGRRPVEVAECQVHEALLNVAVAPDVPLWLRCAYDAQVVDDDVLLEVSRSHPALVEDGEYRGSRHYRGLTHVEDVFTAALPEPRAVADELPFGSAGLTDVRPAVLEAAVAAGIGADRAVELAVAVGEVAANSVRHGGGSGVLRVWEQDGALVCEVRDRGRIEDPMAGRRPPLPDEGGRGLWLAHQLSDLVQVRSGDQGTAVRVHTWLDAPARR